MNDVYMYLPKKITEALKTVKNVEEIRLCAGQKAIAYAEKEILIDCILSAKEINDLVFALSRHSLYAFLDELKRGYFTIAGGVRIGVAGRVVCEQEKVSIIKNFTSLVIRFPNDVIGIGKQILNYIAGYSGNILIVSAPKHGKTTLLRDIVRELSDLGNKCVVIDERCEISGEMKFDLGMRTDVLLACPKVIGISMAVRTLSPDIIATDEIGTDSDLEAIFDAVNSGVRVIATAHGRSMDELKERLFFRKLIEDNVFKCIVVLSDKLGRSTAEQIYIAGEPKLKFPFRLKG